MTARNKLPKPRWEAGTFEGLRRFQLELNLAATPAQRLAWLEEAMAIAHAAKVPVTEDDDADPPTDG